MSGDPTQTNRYLQRLFGKTPGHVSLWEMPSKSAQQFRAGDGGDLVAAAVQAQQWAKAGHCVYARMTTLQSKLDDPFSRGTKKDSCAVQSVWLDIDIGGHANAHLAHKADVKGLPQNVDDVANLLQEMGRGTDVEPSMIVSSGFGVHVYYVLAEPLTVANNQARTNFEALVEAFQDRVIQGAAKYGWHMDRLADVTRVLRVPGTFNFKIVRKTGKAEDAVPCELIYEDPCQYEPDQLWSFVRGEAKPRSQMQVTVDFSQKKSEWEMPADFIERLRTRLADVKTKHYLKVQNLLKGLSLGKAGERDESLKTITAIVANVALNLDLEAQPEPLVVPLFEKSLSLWANEPDADKSLDEELWKVHDKLERAMLKYREEKAQVQKVFDGLMSKWSRAVRGSSNTPVAFKKLQEGKTEEELGKPYTEEELRLFCDMLRVPSDRPAESLRNRWIIHTRGEYWVFCGGRYVFVSESQAKGEGLRQRLAPAPVDHFRVNKDGTERLMTKQDYLEHYSSTAETERFRFATPVGPHASYYDQGEDLFYHAVGNVRPLEPEYHQDVDTWLQLLFGPEKHTVEKGLDWLATVTLLNYQTSGLYLGGKRGAGKNMFAQGVASLWVEGGQPSKMDDVLGSRFNSAMLDCPLIWADESMPENVSMNRLKNLIGSNTHEVTRKFMSTSSASGCVRVVLTANNDRMLASITDHDTGTEDIEAYGERFFFVPVADGAAEFLSSLGSRSGTEGWVDRDIIARHLIWLRDTRAANVRRNGRFLVPGDTTAMHRGLVSQTGLRNSVCEWLVGYLNRPNALVRSQGVANKIMIRNGELLVSVEPVMKHWQEYVQTQGASKSITKTQLARALGTLSDGRVKVEGEWLRRVKIEHLFDWVEVHGVGNEDVMHRTLGLVGTEKGK